MYGFEEKVILITGAAGGIGRAAAIQFAQEGAKVVVADIDIGGLAQTVTMAEGEVLAVTVDVCDEHSCASMVNSTLEAFGRIDVLFNNAGIAGNRAKTADTSTADWQAVIDVNLTGVFFCARAVLPALQKAGGGVIINTASVDGQTGMPTLPHYVAAKHGVIGLTKTIALEYAADKIRAVAIAPGYIKTKMTEEGFTEEEKVVFRSLVPMGRPAEPDEVANMVLWLASDKASYVTGTCHNVDAGLLSGFNLPA